METNYLAVLGAAFVPMIIGSIWYGPLFGKAWMKEMGFTEETMKNGNMPLIFGLSFVCSFIVAFVLQTLVIHQWGAYQLLVASKGFAEQTGAGYELYKNFTENFGSTHRSFGHGALHGGIVGLLLVGSIITIKSLFERRSAKYILMNVSYWVVALALMGGILCQWA